MKLKDISMVSYCYGIEYGSCAGYQSKFTQGISNSRIKKILGN
jgi:hypothetical protein